MHANELAMYHIYCTFIICCTLLQPKFFCFCFVCVCGGGGGGGKYVQALYAFLCMGGIAYNVVQYKGERWVKNCRNLHSILYMNGPVYRVNYRNIT